MSRTKQASSAWRLPLVSLALALLVGLMASAGSASAAGPCGAAGTYKVSGATRTCTYKSSSDSGVSGGFIVPADITSVHVTAVGGKGGNDPGGTDDLGITYPSRTGGFGAVVSASLPVSPGQPLYVYVAGNGQDAQASGAVAAGGANGGGNTGAPTTGEEGDGAGGGAGGGGGASDVRTVPAPTTGAQTGSLDSRLLVAGGGGGSADASDDGEPGDGNGANAGQAAPPPYDGTPAQPGTANPNGTGSGGAGGTDGDPGQNGGQGFGGDGGSDCCYQGGGGGAGLYGGGGGSSLYGQAGAGGASWVEQTATKPSITTDTTGTPAIVISYTLRVSSTSVSCSPRRVAVNSHTKCTVTVKDTGAGKKATPTGKVAFGSSSSGRFSAGSCRLKPTSTKGKASCSVTYKPTAVGSGKHKITARYRGDPGHKTSRASATLAVFAPAVTFTG